MSTIIGVIEMDDGYEISMDESHLSTKRKAEKAAKKFSKRGVWATLDDGSEKFYMPASIKRIELAIPA